MYFKAGSNTSYFYIIDCGYASPLTVPAVVSFVAFLPHVWHISGNTAHLWRCLAHSIFTIDCGTRLLILFTGVPGVKLFF